MKEEIKEKKGRDLRICNRAGVKRQGKVGRP